MLRASAWPIRYVEFSIKSFSKKGPRVHKYLWIARRVRLVKYGLTVIVRTAVKKVYNAELASRNAVDNCIIEVYGNSSFECAHFGR